MINSFNREPMLEIFIFETRQLIEQLEQSILNSEKVSEFNSSIDEIFRIMHTIKGSAAMMLFNDIATLAHAIEDLFYYLREEKPEDLDCSKITDMVLEGIDFIKNEVTKIEQGEEANGEAGELLQFIREYLTSLKQTASGLATVQEEELRKAEDLDQKYYISSDKAAVQAQGERYQAVVFFQEGCEMENVRAFTITHNLKELAGEIEIFPPDIMENNDSVEIIKQEGFKIFFKTEASLEEIESFFSKVAFLREIELQKLKKEIILDESELKKPEVKEEKKCGKNNSTIVAKQNLISVGVIKLDQLMDLVGELVVAEAMVTLNPELAGLPLDNFYKAARQLRKITNELQDIVMSIRMVPLSSTFQKMNRLVRDMSRKIGKEVELEIIGEETEVDKNIIESISDPLMHLIRNALDHGLETGEERVSKGKSEVGKIVIEAKNAGGDVWIIVKDDGKGLDKKKILQRAQEHGLLAKPESEMSDKEIYSLVLLPGFSTKDNITEFSGRGVGMDVAVKCIEKIRGTVLIDSTPDVGTVVSIKIPLTLAIIDGMTIRVGNSKYTVPITGIKESFRAREEDIITDTEGNEMILVRGECYPILRLHEFYKVETEVTEISRGILMMVEHDSKVICLFADQLLGEQQVVVKALPNYIKKVKGVAGCSLLGDGSISLILDIAGLIS